MTSTFTHTCIDTHTSTHICFQHKVNIHITYLGITYSNCTKQKQFAFRHNQHGHPSWMTPRHDQYGHFQWMTSSYGIKQKQTGTHSKKQKQTGTHSKKQKQKTINNIMWWSMDICEPTFIIIQQIRNKLPQCMSHQTPVSNCIIR